MEILYEHIAGTEADIVLSIALWVVAAIAFSFGIYFAITERNIHYAFLFGLFALVIALFGFGVNIDNTYKEVKAIITDEASFKEINDKYQLIKREGEIYTFKVLEDKEQNKK